MSNRENEIFKWCFSLIGYFLHWGFFTYKLWKNVKGFEDEDEANIKCMFMHYWLHNKFGYYTTPCGSSWFSESDEKEYNRYIENYKPVIDYFENWENEQR